LAFNCLTVGKKAYHLLGKLFYLANLGIKTRENLLLIDWAVLIKLCRGNTFHHRPFIRMRQAGFVNLVGIPILIK
jgi:hypothetical protein